MWTRLVICLTSSFVPLAYLVCHVDSKGKSCFGFYSMIINSPCPPQSPTPLRSTSGSVSEGLNSVGEMRNLAKYNSKPPHGHAHPSTALSLSTLRRRHSVHTPVLLTPSAPDYTGTWLNNKFLQCPINSSDSVMRATLPAHGLGGFIVLLLSSCTLTRSSTAFISQQFPFTLKHLRRGDPEISGVLGCLFK